MSLFADDTTTIVTNNNKKALAIRTLQIEPDNPQNCFIKSKINITKTQTILVSRKQDKTDHQLNINGVDIQ